MNALFANRREAGQRLADELAPLRDQRPLVLAIPRGGVPVGFEIAKALGAPLDIVLVRKIGAPFQPELAVGAVVDGEHAETVLHRDVVEMLALSEDFIQKETARQLEEIERRRALYFGGRPRPRIEGGTAIIVDDGIATGATVEAALVAVRRAGPRRLVLAVPVAPVDTVERLREKVDELVCLETPEPFFAIGQFYADFPQLTDDEVTDFLDRAARRAGAGKPASS